MRHNSKTKIRLPIFTILLGLFSIVATGQDNEAMTWYDASVLPIHGKMDTTDTEPFQRFSTKMENNVRERVWALSKNSAGLYLDFKTDATNIIVHYQVEDELAFPHMPATGVSGLDLYAHEEQADWRWVRGNFSFRDTITYRFSKIKPVANNKLRGYRLYIPLYNTIKWLEIGVSENAVFKNSSLSDEKPIIVYGTSIVQGACASRPGMAWTNVLERRLGRPIINLGFSGNGRLEEEIIDFMKKKDASVYVLDCMANFTPGQDLNPEVAEYRIIKAVESLHQERPDIPILLVEHAGYSDGEMQPARKSIYVELNEATQRAYSKLMVNNLKLLYLLKKDDIGLNHNSFVDGTHPNDLGMQQYADAILNKLTEIINN